MSNDGPNNPTNDLKKPADNTREAFIKFISQAKPMDVINYKKKLNEQEKGWNNQYALDMAMKEMRVKEEAYNTVLMKMIGPDMNRFIHDMSNNNALNKDEQAFLVHYAEELMIAKSKSDALLGRLKVIEQLAISMHDTNNSESIRKQILGQYEELSHDLQKMIVLYASLKQGKEKMVGIGARIDKESNKSIRQLAMDDYGLDLGSLSAEPAQRYLRYADQFVKVSENWKKNEYEGNIESIKEKINKYGGRYANLGIVGKVLDTITGIKDAQQGYTVVQTTHPDYRILQKSAEVVSGQEDLSVFLLPDGNYYASFNQNIDQESNKKTAEKYSGSLAFLGVVSQRTGDAKEVSNKFGDNVGWGVIITPENIEKIKLGLQQNKNLSHEQQKPKKKKGLTSFFSGKKDDEKERKRSKSIPGPETPTGDVKTKPRSRSN